MNITSGGFLLTILGFLRFQSAKGWIPLQPKEFYVEMVDGSSYEGRLLRHSDSDHVPDWITNDRNNNPRQNVFIYKAQDDYERYHRRGPFGVYLENSERQHSFPSVPGATDGPTYAEMRFEAEGHPSIRQHYMAGPFTKFTRPPPRRSVIFQPPYVPPIDYVYIIWEGTIYMAHLRHEGGADNAYRAMEAARSHVSPDRDQDAAVHDHNIEPR